MTNVVEFGGITRLDISPDKILEKAIGKLTEVVICGFDADETIYHLERAKWSLMKVIDTETGQ